MRGIPIVVVMALVAWGCADGVIQRMPPPPTDEQPDPIADREVGRVAAAEQWPALVAAFAGLAGLAPMEDYARREDAVEAFLGRLVPELEALQAQGALNPLARLDLALVLEELARARLRVKGNPAASARQAERWDAAARLQRFVDAAAAGSGEAVSPAVCDVLLIADLLKFRMVPPCMQASPQERLLERMPLDARVTVALLLRLAGAASPGI